MNILKILFGPRPRVDNQVKNHFTTIFEKNIFEGDVSVSGRGSDLIQTEMIRREIPLLLKEFDVKRFMDAPCGDFYWMKHVVLPVEQYIGVDIVEAIIKKNQATYTDPQHSFVCLDIIEDPLPPADLMLCRDCLVHLNFAQAIKAIRNFQRSGITYLLTTTFTGRETNVDLGEGDIWRTLNLEQSPFHFPKPLKLINENCTEGDNKFNDKSLGLWRIDDIVAGLPR
jgi:hypothetical protein